jgi:hypothetical protein
MLHIRLLVRGRKPARRIVYLEDVFTYHALTKEVERDVMMDTVPSVRSVNGVDGEDVHSTEQFTRLVRPQSELVRHRYLLCDYECSQQLWRGCGCFQP